MANPSQKATPPKSDETSEPLVNENNPTLTIESLTRKLSDSREEVQRVLKTLKEREDSLAKANEANTHLVAKADQGRSEYAELKAQVEALTAANQKLASERDGIQAENGVVVDKYTGPTQSQIYLALVGGFTSTIDPLKQLDDAKVKALAKSFLGMSEVFFKEAHSRQSFN